MDDMLAIEPRTGEELEHYGRKGMKWYQSIYGSKNKKSAGSSRSSTKKLTPKQKARVEKLRKKQKAKQAKKTESDQRKAQQKALNEAKRRDKILHDPSKLYQHRREFSQDEINQAIKTFEWEKKLSDLSAARVKRGEEMIRSMTSYAANSINLYNQAARIANTFNLGEKPWKYIENPVLNKDKDKKK